MATAVDGRRLRWVPFVAVWFVTVAVLVLVAVMFHAVFL